MSTASRAKLRTKTGCLTCRQRRKKCDEKTPVCEGCYLSKRKCQWPTAAELLDRRFTTHQKSRQDGTETSSQSSQDASASPGQLVKQTESDEQAEIEQLEALWAKYRSKHRPSLSVVRESGTAHKLIQRDIEDVMSHHFVNHYFGLILLPSCHNEFSNGWVTEIQQLMGSHKSLYSSVLACAASHLHWINGSPQMQELSLSFYSRALMQLHAALSTTPHLENHNGVLMSVMLLYLHGCVGRGTYTDIPRHVGAATRILSMRLIDEETSASKPFDVLAVESVLYQTFLMTTGLWSSPVGLDFDFDADFWDRAEKLLDRSKIFDGKAVGLNSPVLGVPVALFRLSQTMRQLYRILPERNQECLDQMRAEVENWEAVLICGGVAELSLDADADRTQAYYRDCSYLFAIIVSIMLEQLSKAEDLSHGPPPPVAPDSWQLKKAMKILQSYSDDDNWARCYMGNWPVYTLGFFVRTDRDIELIRDELRRRWGFAKSGQVWRFTTDLEKTWAARGLVTDSIEDALVVTDSNTPL